MSDIVKFANAMMKEYPTPVRTFGLRTNQMKSQAWLFRRLIANIMVSRSSEENVLVAVEELFEQYPNAEALADASLADIRAVMDRNGVRFSTPKNKYIKNAAKVIHTKYNGCVPEDRAALEALDGVGEHVASVVIALGFGMPAFAVDLHVRRIAKRVGAGLIGEKDNDKVLAKKLMSVVPKSKWGALSRAFVDFGKDVCASNPNCGSCKFREHCDTGSRTVTAPVKAENGVAKLGDGVFKVVAGSSSTPYTVTLHGGKASCNCKGYRFRRTCSHIIQVVNGR